MSRGDTQGAREQRQARQERQRGLNAGKTEGQCRRGREGCRGRTATHGCTTTRTERRHANTRIKPDQPRRPTIRELREGGAGGGGRRRNLPQGVTGEAAQVGLQDGGQVAGRGTREVTQDTALVRRGAAEHTRRRRAALRGRARDKRRGKGGEGRGERGEWRVTRRRGAHLAWPVNAKGHAPRKREDRRQTQRGAVTR